MNDPSISFRPRIRPSPAHSFYPVPNRVLDFDIGKPCILNCRVIHGRSHTEVTLFLDQILPFHRRHFSIKLIRISCFKSLQEEKGAMPCPDKKVQSHCVVHCPFCFDAGNTLGEDREFEQTEFFLQKRDNAFGTGDNDSAFSSPDIHDRLMPIISYSSSNCLPFLRSVLGRGKIFLEGKRMERWQRALSESITSLSELARYIPIDLKLLGPVVARYPLRIPRPGRPAGLFRLSDPVPVLHEKKQDRGRGEFHQSEFIGSCSGVYRKKACHPGCHTLRRRPSTAY